MRLFFPSGLFNFRFFYRILYVFPTLPCVLHKI
jgi:hypothetical protein